MNNTNLEQEKIEDTKIKNVYFNVGLTTNIDINNFKEKYYDFF